MMLTTRTVTRKIMDTLGYLGYLGYQTTTSIKAANQNHLQYDALLFRLVYFRG